MNSGLSLKLAACCRVACARRHMCSHSAICQSALLVYQKRQPSCHSRTYSASLAEQFKLASYTLKKQLPTIFRTEETDPTKHADAHQGLFYKVSDMDIKRLFQRGLSPDYYKQITSFQESCFMVRDPALEMFDYIDQINYSHPASRFVLYGNRGSGKTMVMCHVIHHCAYKDWVIVHVPWPAFWLNHYKEVSVSSHNAHRIDLPYEAVEWLRHFRSQNSVLLKDVKTTQTYKWTKRESSEEGTPLLDIIDFGLNRLKFATDCVGAILKEIKLHASDNNHYRLHTYSDAVLHCMDISMFKLTKDKYTTQEVVDKMTYSEMVRFRVLVAIECVNAFWKDTTIKTDTREFVPAEKLSLVHNFKKMLRSDWTNGLTLCTVDASVNMHNDRLVHTPHHLLGKEGFEHVDPFVPIHVPNYSEKEVYSCLEYYIDRKWIQHTKGSTDEGKKELMYFSNRNPHALNRACAAW